MFRLYHKLNKYDINSHPKRSKKFYYSDEILSSHCVKIRKVSQLLGKFSSSLINVPQGKLYYRSLEINKVSTLKINK